MAQLVIELILIILLYLGQIFPAVLIVLTVRKILKKRSKNLPYPYELGLIAFFLINLLIWNWDNLFYYFLVPLNIGFENFTNIEEVFFHTVTLVSLILVIFTLERLFLPKLKHVFSIYAVSYLTIVTITGLIFDFDIVDVPFNYLNIPIIAFLPFFYFYLILRGSSAIRKSSIYFLIGFTIVLAGGMSRYQTLLHSVSIYITPVTTLIFRLLAPMGLITGGVFLLFGFFKIKNYFYIPIESIYIFKKESGLCIYEHAFQESKLGNPQLFTGGIWGMTQFFSETTISAKALKEIDLEDLHLIIDYGKIIGVAIISRERLRIIRQNLIDFIKEFEIQFKSALNAEALKPKDFESSLELFNRHFEYSLVEEI